MLEDRRAGRYLRIEEAGELYSTEDGPYVSGIITGELDEQGVRRRGEYSCYLDGQGRLVRLNRSVESR